MESFELLRGFSIFCAIIALYSFVINYIFGHKSFWRNFPEYLCLQITKCVRITRKTVTTRKSSRNEPIKLSFSIQNLNDSLIIHCLTYMEPYDLLSLSVASKTMRELSDHSFLWNHYQLRLKQAALEIFPDSATFEKRVVDIMLTMVSNKRKTFELFRKLSQQILHQSLEDQKCFVLIHHKIYDLTQFQQEHPGGAAVLEAWKGKDATVPFLNAFHSLLAKDLSRNYLIWDKDELMGKRRNYV